MRHRLGDMACCLILLALGLTVALPRFQHGIDLADEGFLAYGAVRVMDGQVPNLDFVSLQPPLSFYSVAAAFRLFGTSLLTMRVLGLGFHLLIPILLFSIARHVSRPVFALAAAVPATVIGLPLFNFVPFAVWHGIVAAAAAGVAFLQATTTTRRAWAFLAGVATAFVLLSRHDQGVYLALAISGCTLVCVWIDDTGTARRATARLWWCWALGAALPLLPLAGYWLHARALSPMFAQLIVFPLSMYGKTSALPMPQPGTHLSVAANVQAMQFYLPPLLAGLTGVCLLGRALRHGRSRADAPVAFLVLWSLLFYCQVLTRSDVWHLTITLAPFFALCAWWLERAERTVSAALARRSAGGHRYLTTHAMATVVALSPAVVLWSTAFHYSHDLYLNTATGPERRLTLDRAGGVYAHAEVAEGLENVTGLIQTQVPVDRSILCLPYQPMLYFLSGRRNPTRWNYLWPGDQSERDQADFVAQARRDEPAMALVVKRAEVREYARTIMDYVDDDYRIVEQIGTLTVHVPRDP